MRLLTFLLLLPISIQANAASVHLRAEAELRADRMRLGDVADIEGERGEVESLSAIDLGLSPRTDRTERIHRAQIEDFARRRYPASAEAKWSGAAQVIVKRKAYPVEREDIEQALLQALNPRASQAVGRIEVKGAAISTTRPGFELRLARLDMSVDCRSGRAVMEAHTEAGKEKSFVVSFASDSQTGDRDVDCFAHVVHVLASERRSIAPSQQEGITQRQQPLSVQVREGGVVVDTVAIAMADAAVGRTVLVRNPDSTETYRVMVIAPGRAVAMGN